MSHAFGVSRSLALTYGHHVAELARHAVAAASLKVDTRRRRGRSATIRGALRAHVRRAAHARVVDSIASRLRSVRRAHARRRGEVLVLPILRGRVACVSRVGVYRNAAHATQHTHRHAYHRVEGTVGLVEAIGVHLGADGGRLRRVHVAASRTTVAHAVLEVAAHLDAHRGRARWMVVLARVATMAHASLGITAYFLRHDGWVG